MKTVRMWITRLTALMTGRTQKQDADFSDELASHLEMHVADNVRAGMSPAEARRAANLKFAGLQSAREAYHDQSTVPVLEHLAQDIRYGLRQWRLNPGFALAAVIVLTLGISSAIAIFAFVDAALIQPLPYANPSRLAAVTESIPMFPKANLSYQDYLDWKKASTSFESFDVYGSGGFLLRTSSGTEPVSAARVSGGFFRTLGVQPVLGRSFADGEELPGHAPVVMLSHGTWIKRFGGRTGIVGETLTLSGSPFTVIGILPPHFQFAPRGRAEFWTTINTESNCLKRRSCHNLNGIARLKPGVSFETAFANVKTIAAQLEKQYPDSNRGQGAFLEPLSDYIQGEIRPLLQLLLGGAALLLLIAGVNVVGLLLERAENRRRELAVRTALGASRSRLVTQFVTEGVMLAGLAAAAGVLLAAFLVPLLGRLIPEDMLASLPFLRGIGLNSHSLLVATGIAILAAVTFSLAPSLYLLASNPRAGLAEGSRGSAGLAWRRLGSKLVVVELAVAMVLLVGAGLLSQSLYRLLGVDLGFEPDQLATVDVNAPYTRYGKAEQNVAFARLLIERVAAIPGVQSVGLTTLLPVSGNGNTTWMRIVGKPFAGEHNECNMRSVSASFFPTIGARLVAGRYFTDAEDHTKPRVVIVNQALARKYFPGENAVGQRLGNHQLTPDSIREIVGVVDDVRDAALDQEIWPAIYEPYNQDPDTEFAVVVRVAQSPGAVLPSLVSTIRRIDGDIGTSGETTVADRINASPAAYLRRSSASLVAGFAAIALLLSIVGLYGVIAYSVSQRTREIGVRMALGAEPGSIHRLILTEAGALVGFGVLFGIVCSLGATTVAGTLLFGIRSWDPPTLGSVALVLALFALLASLVPARKAAAVNPVEALRAE